MHMSVTQTGVRRTTRRLDGVAYSVTHAKPAFREVAVVIAAANERGYKRMKRNAPSTLAAKQSTQPLVRTGKSKADLTDARRGTLHVSDDALVFGTMAWYLRFSQKGTKHEPRRRALKFGAPTKKASVEIIRQHALEALLK